MAVAVVAASELVAWAYSCEVVLVSSVQDDLVAQYEAAKELAFAIEAAWVREGSPLTTEGGATGRAVVTHPLVTLLQIARRDVERFAKPLAGRNRGPEPKSVVQARMGKAPSSSKLKAVKSA